MSQGIVNFLHVVEIGKHDQQSPPLSFRQFHLLLRKCEKTPPVIAFMMNLFRAGAFQGSTPSQAFFVKCDEETNPQSEIDAGVVNVLVGFAPVRPAEFVVIKISQKAADAAS